MSDAVVLQIDVGGDRGWIEASPLGAWLERVPDVRADAISPPARKRFGRLSAVRVVVRVTSAAAAQGLPQALAEWLATRKSTVTLRISYADGEVLELQGGTPVEEVARRIESALASLGLEPPAADPSRETAAPADDGRQAQEELVERLKLTTTKEIAIDVEPLEALPAEERLRQSLDADPELAPLLSAIFAREEDWQAFFRRWYEPTRRVGDPVSDGASDESGVPILPVTIYLSEEGIRGQVEAAVGEFLNDFTKLFRLHSPKFSWRPHRFVRWGQDKLLEAALDASFQRIANRESVIWSWFRRMRAAAKEAARSPAAREGALVAAHAVDTRLVLAQDATVTATLLQNLGPVIASLQPTKDAVLRVGALLIVKVDWAVNVFQLTAAQQAKLDHQPRLSVSPHEIIAALDLTHAAQTDDGPLSLE